MAPGAMVFVFTRSATAAGNEGYFRKSRDACKTSTPGYILVKKLFQNDFAIRDLKYANLF